MCGGVNDVIGRRGVTMETALRLNYLKHVSFAVVAFWTICAAFPCTVGDEKAEPAALPASVVGRLFEDSVLSDNVFAIRAAANELPGIV